MDDPGNRAPGSRIGTEEVAKVAALARLRLGDDELERFTHQLADILDHAADIEALDLDGVEPMAHPVRVVNVLRDDTPGEPLDRAEVLAQAPAAEDGQFRVPPVLGEAP
jgi:aspartyl-tRNA(Asn)/glutamyl-tRNA(Gln) amidotransferase subunit C